MKINSKEFFTALLLTIFALTEAFVFYIYFRSITTIQHTHHYEQLNIELSNYLDENIDVNIDEEITKQEATLLIDEKAIYTIL